MNAVLVFLVTKDREYYCKSNIYIFSGVLGWWRCDFRRYVTSHFVLFFVSSFLHRLSASLPGDQDCARKGMKHLCSKSSEMTRFDCSFKLQEDTFESLLSRKNCFRKIKSLV